MKTKPKIELTKGQRDEIVEYKEDARFNLRFSGDEFIRNQVYGRLDGIRFMEKLLNLETRDEE